MRFKFATEKSIFNETVSIAFIKMEDGKRYMGKMSWVEMKEAEPTVPTLTIDGALAEGLYKSIVEDLKYHGELKVAPEAELNKGIAQAQKEHLNDLRKLVFEDDHGS